MNTGHLTIVSGPSGSGKSTLIKRFIHEHPEFAFPTSVTTRKPRPGEINGDHYCFVSTDEFEGLKKENAFLEWACVYDLMYGTLKETIEQGLKYDKQFIKDIDVQGSLSLIKVVPKPHLTTIFVSPPSLETLEERLRGRGSEDESALGKRLDEAKNEMDQKDHFDHLIVNEDLEASYQDFCKIICT